MARWRLLEPHYLKVPNIFWEQSETDRETGRKKRIEHPVPLYLNPNHPSDWSHRPSGASHVITGGNSFTEGVIIVAHAGKTDDKKDIIFEGDPTPGMEPIDDEAREISEALKPQWAKIEEFTEGVSNAERQMIASQEIITGAIVDSQKQLHEVLAMMAETQKQMAQMMQAFVSNGRRV